MNSKVRTALVELEMLLDLAICMGTLICASATDSTPLWQKQTLLLQKPLSQLLLAVGLIWAWHHSLIAVGVYHSHRLSSWRQLAIMFAKASLLTTACSALWSMSHLVALGRYTIPASGIAFKASIFLVVSYTLFLSSRLVSRTCTTVLRRNGRNLRYVLIIGANQRAITVADFLTRHPSFGYRLVGFVDDKWYSSKIPDRFANMLIGDLSTLPTLLRTVALDEVVTALPIASQYKSIRHIVTECRKQGIIVRCEGSLFDIEGKKFVYDNPPLLITLNERCWNHSSVVMKRALDILVSFSALLLLSPIFAMIAASIKLTSPGSIFFSQERIGYGKRRFKIYKFRTMVPNAEKLIHDLAHLNQSVGPTFKLANDPRITRIGRVLRKTSLDELPQLVNVFWGDMSLVGPRPLPVRDYNGFSDDWHRRRFSVRPGITCLWQVMGRSSITFDRWMELDLSYIDTWSIWLDVKILLQTIPVVLRGSGAV